MTAQTKDTTPHFVLRIMPKATDDELDSASEAFEDYMQVVWTIFQRIRRDLVTSDSPTDATCDRVEGTQHAI